MRRALVVLGLMACAHHMRPAVLSSPSPSSVHFRCGEREVELKESFGNEHVVTMSCAGDVPRIDVIEHEADYASIEWGSPIPASAWEARFTQAQALVRTLPEATSDTLALVVRAGAWSRAVDCHPDWGSGPLPACAGIVEAIWGLEALAPAGVRDAAWAAGPDLTPRADDYDEALRQLGVETTKPCLDEELRFTVLSVVGAVIEDSGLACADPATQARLAAVFAVLARPDTSWKCDDSGHCRAEASDGSVLVLGISIHPYNGPSLLSVETTLPVSGPPSPPPRAP